MGPDERQEAYQGLVERRNILVHRRRLLEKQKDVLGVETPPGTLIQIDQTNKEIELIEGQIRYLDIDPKTLALAGETGVWAALTTRVERLERDVRQGLASVFEEIAADREERMDWRRREGEERRIGQEKTRWWLILLTFGQVIGLALMGLVVYMLASALGEALIAGR